MSDPNLKYACTICGADAGEPCVGDCPGGDPEQMWPEQQTLWGESDEPDEAQAELPLIDQAQSALMASVYRLPFSGLIDTPPDYRGTDADLWLAKLAVWMHAYQQLLVGKVAELEAGNKRAIGLQLEKDVVRQFFGSEVLT